MWADLLVSSMQCSKPGEILRQGEARLGAGGLIPPSHTQKESVTQEGQSGFRFPTSTLLRSDISRGETTGDAECELKIL